MDGCASFCVVTSYGFISLNSLQGEAVQRPRLLINVQDDQKLFTTAIELAFTNDWRSSCSLVSTRGYSTASQPQRLDPPDEAFLSMTSCPTNTVTTAAIGWLQSGDYSYICGRANNRTPLQKGVL